MIKRYEILILAAPEITEDEINIIELALQKLIKSAQGEFISFDKWGKYRLAYPVQNKSYGVYCLIRFAVEQTKDLFKDINALFTVKYNSIIMRTVTKYIDNNKSLEYQRPVSVEDAPARDVDTFLRENKMDGLLASPLNSDIETEDSVCEIDILEKK